MKSPYTEEQQYAIDKMNERIEAKRLANKEKYKYQTSVNKQSEYHGKDKWFKRSYKRHRWFGMQGAPQGYPTVSVLHTMSREENERKR